MKEFSQSHAFEYSDIFVPPLNRITIEGTSLNKKRKSSLQLLYVVLFDITWEDCYIYSPGLQIYVFNSLIMYD